MMIIIYIIVFLSIALEPFPISSSGHIQLLVRILHTLTKVPSESLLKIFDFISYGPIALVLALFFFKRWKYLLNISRSWPLIITMIVNGTITEFITLFFYCVCTGIGTAYFPLFLGFLMNALALISLIWCPTKNTTRWNSSNAILLGIAQGLAFLPGVSRFASTFVVARWCGFSHRKAFEISFLIEWPIAVAAWCKGICDSITLGYGHFLNLPFWLSMLSGGIVAYAGLYIISYLVEKNLMWIFSLWLLVSALCAYCLV